MKLNISALNDKSAWASAGVRLPQFDVPEVAKRTDESPIWLHFGAGNIFRGFVGSIQQRLLNQGLSDCGIIAADTFDYEIIDKIYKPFDNLTLNVSLNPDGSTDCEILGSVVGALKADCTDESQMSEFRRIFAAPSLQMVSFTITEKGYAIRNTSGELLPTVKSDIENGPEQPHHAMSFVAAMLLHRFKTCKSPLAVVSMDNCSHNGEKLKNAVCEVASAWVKKGFAGREYLDYIEDNVSFPWSMIDKITPRPAKPVEEKLSKIGVENMSPIITSKGTYIAPFVNAEKPEYLVIEDDFPNGRPPLERAGVYLTDRDTVNKTERMKVTTCLNPLHTALAVYGCMLGYTLICDEMKDAELVKLIKKLGYDEGLPVVTDPGIISPKAFIDEVVNERLPNPFMPDAPQRIATDTSQKVGIRFGETIKSYAAAGRAADLTAIPLAIAGWLRYLLAVDDDLQPIEVSSDPLKDELQAKLRGIEIGRPETVGDKLIPILENANIFGSDLVENGLSGKIEGYFKELIAGKGAVRKTLKKYL